MEWLCKERGADAMREKVPDMGESPRECRHCRNKTRDTEVKDCHEAGQRANYREGRGLKSDALIPPFLLPSHLFAAILLIERANSV